jgi:hypothetical protein
MLDFNSSTSIHTNAYVQSGATNVFRYIYGAIFAGAFQMAPRSKIVES